MFALNSKLGAIALALVTVGTIIAPNAEAKTVWTKETQRKYEKMVNMGYPKNVAKSLIDECKKSAKDPGNCVLIGASILAAESTYGTNCTKHHNCFGMEDGRTKYRSKEEGVKDWVSRYNRFWFRQNTPDSFYSNTPKRIPVTAYCMGGSAGFCENGHRNAWKAFNKLK